MASWLLAALLQVGGPELPVGFQTVDRLQSIDRPTGACFAPDGSLLLALKRGEVQRFLVDPLDPDGALLPQGSPILDLSAEVNESGDRGLNGMILTPDLDLSGGPGPIPDGWIYLSYTASPELDTDPVHGSLGPISRGVVERWPLVLEAGGDWIADPLGREVLLGALLPDGSSPDALASTSDVHATGSLTFGSDGTLLIAAGEGARSDAIDQGGGDPAAFDDWIDPDTGWVGPIPADQDCGAMRSQQLNSLAGKVLRVDPATGLGLPSNPFFDGDPGSAASRVYALGLRNPFTLERTATGGSLDPADGDPGTLWVGDVGRSSFEELDRIDTAGANFGWPCREGPEVQAQFESADALDPNPHGCPSCDDLSDLPYVSPAVAWPRFDPAEAIPEGGFLDAAGQPSPGLTGFCTIAGIDYAGGNYPDEFDGRFFAGDFGLGWLASVESDPNDGTVTVHEFGTGFETLVDVIRHPETGNLWILSYGTFVLSGSVEELVYSGLPTPVAALQVTPQSGPAPLAIQLDASASSDPGMAALVFEFDFGDGTAPVVGAAPLQSHIYSTPGTFTASVRVTSPNGAEDVASEVISVGSGLSGLALINPVQNATFLGGDTIVLSAQAEDPSLDLSFTVDLHHNSHVHPAFFQADGPLASFPVEEHGVGGDLYYYRVTATGDNGVDPPESEHVYIYIDGQVRDISGNLSFTSSLEMLNPPIPTGPANSDPEVLRDGIVPSGSTGALSQTFSTEHDGDQGSDDWIGWVAAEPTPPDQRLVELVLTEGIPTGEGGWFESVTVEARIGGTWAEVENLHSFPPYPGGPAAPTESFRTTRFRFDPVEADGLRLRGVPGGTTGFVSASELRVLAVTPDPSPAGLSDFTALGEPIAFALETGWPLGPANPDPGVLVDGTTPQPGSFSLHASFDSAAIAPVPGEDWYGLKLGAPARLSRVDLFEGAVHSGGGAFKDLRVETRLAPNSPWTAATGLSIDPPLSTGAAWIGYERFELTFDPVVAREVRIIGNTTIPGRFGSVSELRVFGPEPPSSNCGTFTYGEEFGPFGVSWSTATVPLAGENMAVLLLGPGPGVGVLGVAYGSAEIPLGAGDWMLIDPAGSFFVLTLPFETTGPFDCTGEALLTFPGFADPSLFGGSLFLQGVHVGASALSFSPGFEIRFCP